VDFDLRQWLLILGPIFIIGVLLHGYFRMRSGQNDIKMKLDRSFLSRQGEDHVVDDLSLFKAELPNGGARLLDSKASAVISANDVPLLTDSVELPSISATSSVDLPKTDSLPASTPEPIPEPEKSAIDHSVDEVPAKAPPARKAPKIEEDQSDEETAAPIRKPEMFVVIYVLALDEPFLGQGLVEVMLDSGMTFGEMDIFHQLNDRGAQLFSLASAVEPGTFDLSSLDQFSTPGISLFMRVHELAAPLQVLDSMLSVANRVAQELNGEVRDETRSVMTPQTIEHCRQSLTEFLYKHSA
jgi:cell division protein ZipA